jgi:hypothetical protein
MRKLQTLAGALALILITSVAGAQTCDGVFRSIGETLLPGYDGPVRVEQARACFASGSCVVLINKPSNRQKLSSTIIREILGANGRLVDHEYSGSPAVNCHGYSCAVIGIPGLPKWAWIDAKDLRVLVKEFFVSQNLRFDSSEFQNFASNQALRENDLVVMVNFQNVANHTGVVRKVNAGGRVENWVESKLDEDVVVLTPLQNLRDHYQLEAAIIYRRR